MAFPSIQGCSPETRQCQTELLAQKALLDLPGLQFMHGQEISGDTRKIPGFLDGSPFKHSVLLTPQAKLLDKLLILDLPEVRVPTFLQGVVVDVAAGLDSGRLDSGLQRHGFLLPYCGPAAGRFPRSRESLVFPPAKPFVMRLHTGLPPSVKTMPTTKCLSPLVDHKVPVPPCPSPLVPTCPPPCPKVPVPLALPCPPLISPPDPSIPRPRGFGSRGQACRAYFCR